MAEIHTEGLKYTLEAAHMDDIQSVPAQFYIGLCTDASLNENDGISELTEVTGTGYERREVASSVVGFASEGAGTNDRKLTTATVNFTPSADDWDDAKMAFLTNVASGDGLLLWSGALSTTRSLLVGDILQVSMTLQLNG